MVAQGAKERVARKAGKVFPSPSAAELRWCAVSLNEVLKRGARLEASVFGIEGRQARELVHNCKHGFTNLTGPGGIACSYYPNRFKRLYVEESEYPLILPSEMQSISPELKGCLSPFCRTDFEKLKARTGQILLSRSGTVGSCSVVSRTLSGKCLSDDIIRLTCSKPGDVGYTYAFLLTKVGNALVRSSEYGAVVSHIEPEHLDSIPIPDPPEEIKQLIHELVTRSYGLRDESNDLLKKAEALLLDELNLPPFSRLRPNCFRKRDDLRNYQVMLSSVDGRFDASYHVPIVETILALLRKQAAEVTTIGDPRVSREIILPGRFKRVYVEEGHGVVFIGGKQIHQLDPANKKYVSLKHHGERIRSQLMLEENAILVTRSGTVGKVALVPKHWEGWTASEHIIRIIASSPVTAGYLFVFLASSYGKELITRFTYGAVVDEIDDYHVSQVPVPILRDGSVQEEVGRLALKANGKRTEAYNLEQEAIRITEEEVIYA